jgi:AsmA protein
MTLGLLAALALVVALDRGILTEALIAGVEAETGRDLSIDGGLRITLLPEPGLVAEGVRLAGAPGIGDAPLIRVGRAAVGLRAGALLVGRIEPTWITLSEVSVNLVLDQDGRGNWQSFPVADVGPDTPGPTEADSGTGSAPAAEIPADLTQAGSPPAGSTSGRDPIASLTSPAGPALPTPAEGLAPAAPPLGGLRVTDASLTWEDQTSGRRVLARDLHLTAAPSADGGPLRLDIEARLGPAQAGAETRVVLAAELRTDGTGGFAATGIRARASGPAPRQGFPQTAELKGTLRVADHGAVRFDLALDGLDLDPYLRPPRGAAGMTHGQAAGDSAAVPPSPGPGAGTQGLAGQVETTPLAAPEPPLAAADSPALSAPPSPSAPAEVPTVPAAPLPPAQGLEGRLLVGRLGLAGLDLHQLEIDATTEDGELRLDHRVAGFYGGSLAGTLRLDLVGEAPRIHLETAAQGFDAGPLLAGLTGFGALTGRGDLSVSVGTQGHDPATLIGGLQGDLALRLVEGDLVGFDLGAMIEGAGGAVQGRFGAGPAAGGRPDWTQDGMPSTPFDELSASAVVTNGVLRSDDLIALSPWLRATGSGTLDLADGRLDWRLLPMLLKPPKGRALKELEGVPIPVLLTGTVAAPVWRVDIASALLEVARRKLGGQGDGPLDGLEQRTGVRGLNGILRGLLGR